MTKCLYDHDPKNYSSLVTISHKQNIVTFRTEVRYVLQIAWLLLSHPRHMCRGLLVPARINRIIAELLSQEFERHPVEFIRIHNLTMYLNKDDPSLSPVLAILGIYEPEVTKAFERSLEEGDIVVDVGANIGWFTLLSSHLVGPLGQVFAFEPETSSFEILSKSVEMNKLPNARVFKQAIWNSEGIAWLNLWGTTQHTMKSHDQGNRIQVETTTIDMFVKRNSISTIKLLKLDVEGAEPEAIDGAKEAITNGLIQNIIMEWNAENWNDKREILYLLEQRYDFYKLTGEHCQYPSIKLFKSQAELSIEEFPRGGNLLLRARGKG